MCSNIVYEWWSLCRVFKAAWCAYPHLHWWKKPDGVFFNHMIWRIKWWIGVVQAQSLVYYLTLVSTFFHFLKFSGNLSAVVQAKCFYQIARGFGLVTDLMEAQKRGFFCNSVSWLGPKHEQGFGSMIILPLSLIYCGRRVVSSYQTELIPQKKSPLCLPDTISTVNDWMMTRSATETHPLSNSNNTHNGIFIQTGLTLQQVIRHVYEIHQNVENLRWSRKECRDWHWVTGHMQRCLIVKSDKAD